MEAQFFLRRPGFAIPFIPNASIYADTPNRFTQSYVNNIWTYWSSEYQTERNKRTIWATQSITKIYSWRTCLAC